MGHTARNHYESPVSVSHEPGRSNSQNSTWKTQQPVSVSAEQEGFQKPRTLSGRTTVIKLKPLKGSDINDASKKDRLKSGRIQSSRSVIDKPLMRQVMQSFSTPRDHVMAIFSNAQLQHSSLNAPLPPPAYPEFQFDIMNSIQERKPKRMSEPLPTPRNQPNNVIPNSPEFRSSKSLEQSVAQLVGPQKSGGLGLAGCEHINMLDLTFHPPQHHHHHPPPQQTTTATTTTTTTTATQGGGKNTGDGATALEAADPLGQLQYASAFYSVCFDHLASLENQQQQGGGGVGAGETRAGVEKSRTVRLLAASITGFFHSAEAQWKQDRAVSQALSQEVLRLQHLLQEKEDYIKVATRRFNAESARLARDRAGPQVQAPPPSSTQPQHHQYQQQQQLQQHQAEVSSNQDLHSQHRDGQHSQAAPLQGPEISLARVLSAPDLGVEYPAWEETESTASPSPRKGGGEEPAPGGPTMASTFFATTTTTTDSPSTAMLRATPSPYPAPPSTGGSLGESKLQRKGPLVSCNASMPQSQSSELEGLLLLTDGKNPVPSASNSILMNDLVKCQMEVQDLKEKNRALTVEIIAQQDILKRARALMNQRRAERFPICEGDCTQAIEQATQRLQAVMNSLPDDLDDSAMRENVSFVACVLTAAREAAVIGERGGGLAFQRTFLDSVEHQMRSKVRELEFVAMRESVAKFTKKQTDQERKLELARLTAKRMVVNVVDKWRTMLQRIFVKVWYGHMMEVRRTRKSLSKIFRTLFAKQETWESIIKEPFQAWKDMTRQKKMRSMKVQWHQEVTTITQDHEGTAKELRQRQHQVESLTKQVTKLEYDLELANITIRDNLNREAEDKLRAVQQMLQPVAAICLALGDAAMESLNNAVVRMKACRQDATELYRVLEIADPTFCKEELNEVGGVYGSEQARKNTRVRTRRVSNITPLQERLDMAVNTVSEVGAEYTEEKMDRQKEMMLRAELINVDNFLLLWTNYHLKVRENSGIRGAHMADNFESSFDDGRTFGQLLYSIAPKLVEKNVPEMLTTMDPAHRIQLMMQVASQLDPPVTAVFRNEANKGDSEPETFTLGVTQQEKRETTAAFLAQLFCTHPSLHTHFSRSDETLIVTNAVEHVQRQWTESAAPFLAVLSRTEEQDQADPEFDEATKKMLDSLPKGELRKRAEAKALEVALARRQVDRAKEPQPDEYLKYATLTEKLAQQIATVNSVSALVDQRLRTGFDMYHKLKARCLHFSYDVMNCWRRRVPVPLMDKKAEAEKYEFTHLTPSNLEGLFEQQTKEEMNLEMDKIREFLSEKYAYLAQVFKFYAAGNSDEKGAAVSTMDFNEYWMLTKDLLLTTKSPKMSQTKLYTCFQEVVEMAAKIRKEKGIKKKKKGEEDEKVLEPRNFVEVLIKIAHSRYRAKNPNLIDCVTIFINQDMETNAARVDTDPMRQVLRAPLVEKVFKHHRKALERVFAFYAGQDKSDKTDKIAMNINDLEFLQMLKEIAIVPKVISEADVHQIFANIQKDEVGDTAGASQMDYGEFMEAVAAITSYCIPNPYLGFDQKLDTFIQEVLLAKAKQAKASNESVQKLVKQNEIEDATKEAQQVNVFAEAEQDKAAPMSPNTMMKMRAVNEAEMKLMSAEEQAQKLIAKIL